MTAAMATRMGPVSEVEAVWMRVSDVVALPADLDAAALAAMDDAQFTALVRTHLVPRENQVAGRHRWQRLWATLAGDAALRGRAGSAVAAMLATTEAALGLDDFAQGQRRRALRFARACDQALERLAAPPGRQGPLGWAGEGAAAFNAPSRAVIARLVSAIATHRTAVASREGGTAADEQLWAVLRATGLDPADHRRP